MSHVALSLLILTYQLHLQTQASHTHVPYEYICTKSRSKVSWFKRQSGNKRTDGRTDGSDCTTFRSDTVGKCFTWNKPFGQLRKKFHQINTSILYSAILLHNQKSPLGILWHFEWARLKPNWKVFTRCCTDHFIQFALFTVSNLG